MAAVTNIKLTTLLKTPDNEEVNACCAPMTSELILDIKDPVWVLVKNAMDCFCTCTKTWERRS